MDTKLTLKLDKLIIERAKKYATAHRRSLSRIIESYLQSLTTPSTDEIQISPFIKSISSGVSIPIDLNVKEEYRAHLEKKHK